MPTYAYKCPSCEHAFDVRKSVSEYDSPESCPECSTEAEKQITGMRFNLPGDDWPGKNMRVNKQMAAKNARLRKKEEEIKRDAPGVTLAPNVDGERVGSWSEAKKLAESKGKDASSYDSYIRKEQALKKSPSTT